MGQSPWFLLQFQAEAHSLGSLLAGRHREHQWYPSHHKDRPSFPVPLGAWTPSAETGLLERSSLSLCLLPPH